MRSVCGAVVWGGERALHCFHCSLHRVPREGGGPVARLALILVQENWIPAFAGNADLKVRFRDGEVWLAVAQPGPVSTAAYCCEP